MEIQIPRQVYAKIMHWVNKSNDEVSGFGKCTYYAESKVLYVHDAYLLKQTNGAAHTDIDGASLAKLLYTSREEEGELKWWWHSHVNMAVFWSGTDTATIKELASQGWMGATVFNKKDEMRSAIGMKVSSLLGDDVVIRDELPTYIMDDITDEMTKAWDEEYKNNVEERKPYSSVYSPGFNSSLLDDDTRFSDRGQTYRTPTYPQNSIYAPEKADDLEYYKNFGWTGAGAWEEAKVLGIHYQKWVKMLMDNDVKIYDEHDQVLDVALQDGRLKPRKEFE